MSHFKKTFTALTLLLLPLLSLAQEGSTDDVFHQVYKARLSEKDHFSSSGQRLKTAAAILRQDRANFHVFNIKDAEDEYDETFKNKEAREYMEKMVVSISETTEKAVLNGTPIIQVEVFGDGGAEVTLITESGVIDKAFANMKCSEVTYGTDSYFEKMEALSKKAGLSPDGNFSRYHEDVVKALCSGDMQDVTNSIDGGFVEAKDVSAISKILGVPYTVKVAPPVQETIQLPQPVVQQVEEAPQNTNPNYVRIVENEVETPAVEPSTFQKMKDLLPIDFTQNNIRIIKNIVYVALGIFSIILALRSAKKSQSLPTTIVNNQVKTEQFMSETVLNTLKDRISTKTWHFVLLTIATAGIYPILWLYRNHNVINEVTNSKSATDAYIIWIAVCVGLGTLVPRDQDPTNLAITALLGIASWVLYVVWAFRARKSLQEYCLTEHKIDLRMNAFYTVIFHVYYINYCINDLEEVARKHKILYQS